MSAYLSIYVVITYSKCNMIHCRKYFPIIPDSQKPEDGPYRGKYIGKFNSYHHQASGDVYAVDEYTFLITGFNYDGNGVDTFFWSGASNRPGPQGFIVPDEYGK